MDIRSHLPGRRELGVERKFDVERPSGIPDEPIIPAWRGTSTSVPQGAGLPYRSGTKCEDLAISEVS